MAGGWKVPGEPGLHGKTLAQKKASNYVMHTDHNQTKTNIIKTLVQLKVLDHS